MTLQDSDDLFDCLALPIQGAHLFGAEAQPVGGVVLAAVSRHKGLDVAGQKACGLPILLVQILRECLALKTPIFLS
jgi:hypothetical protein